jgi:hypothetical protein
MESLRMINWRYSSEYLRKFAMREKPVTDGKKYFVGCRSAAIDEKKRAKKILKAL